MAGEAARVGEGALVAQDVDEHAVAPFGVQPVDRLREDTLIVQLPFPGVSRQYNKRKPPRLG